MEPPDVAGETNPRHALAASAFRTRPAGGGKTHLGARRPMITGALVCTLGTVGCGLAPSIGWLIAFRVVQGFGGGLAR